MLTPLVVGAGIVLLIEGPVQVLVIVPVRHTLGGLAGLFHDFRNLLSRLRATAAAFSPCSAQTRDHYKSDVATISPFGMGKGMGKSRGGGGGPLFWDDTTVLITNTE